jgi:hypothetical protein
MRSTLELLQLHWFDAPRVCGKVLQLCYGEIFAMAAAGRKRDIAIRVMVTAKERANQESGEQGGDADVRLCSCEGA